MAVCARSSGWLRIHRSSIISRVPLRRPHPLPQPLQRRPSRHRAYRRDEQPAVRPRRRKVPLDLRDHVLNRTAPADSRSTARPAPARECRPRSVRNASRRPPRSAGLASAGPSRLLAAMSAACTCPTEFDIRRPRDPAAQPDPPGTMVRESVRGPAWGRRLTKERLCVKCCNARRLWPSSP